uniref:Glycosyltransferase 2-like domain-containing protein n=1 Tax=Ostreococcus sp. 'lucimarinus' TaxID=242159 RepID=A0A7R9XR66_9CHLO|tara:strand:- start:353 stop:1165 length:813 start_codon:yes stop_codon:yes gene_type:complete
MRFDRAGRDGDARDGRRASSSRAPSSKASFTVVIPALNEETRVREAIASARANASARVIVVDGGSTDATVRVARKHGASVVRSERGRGRQMNAGAAAAAATGTRDASDVLVFLHADSTLPTGYGELITRALAKRVTGRSREWGAFEFKMGGEREDEGFARTCTRRAIEFGTNARCRLFGMPYGDQALVMRRETFDSVGGFDELPFMEDYIMARKLRRRGAPALFSAPVTTSGRRWDERGFSKVTLMNQVIILGYHIGVPMEKLAEWYKKT